MWGARLLRRHPRAFGLLALPKLVWYGLTGWLPARTVAMAAVQLALFLCLSWAATQITGITPWGAVADVTQTMTQMREGH